MRFTLSFTVLSCILLASCASSAGISKESSRIPKGNPNAIVTVKEFSDLQCPACRTVHLQVVTPIIQNYGDRIRFEFKHFPLQSIHPFALPAAMASECAADQGKFWEYIDLAYINQDELNASALEEWAAELSLDTELFARCLKSKVKRGTVLDDYNEARDIGLSGTPTFFVNGVQVPTNDLVRAIKDAESSLIKRL